MMKRIPSIQSACMATCYPMFRLLMPDGKTEVVRLKAGRGKTPESFMKEIEEALIKRKLE